MERSQIVDAYINRVLELRREREGRGVEQDELEQIAFESGLSREDLELARAETQKSILRGRGFLSYGNWGRAVGEFEGAVALDPNNPQALALLAHALWNHGVAEEEEPAQYRAMQYAERAIQIDPANAAGVKLVTHMTTKPGEPYGGRVTRKGTTATGETDGPARKILVLAAGAAVMVMGVAVAIFVAADQGEFADEQEGARLPVSSYERPGEEPFAEEVASFGRKGTGAGYFDDARFIGVDAVGNLYVGEYGSGRVQVVDRKGNWLAEWTIPGENALRSLAVARDGTVWTVRDGRITRVNGLSGEVLGVIDYEQGRGFDDVYATPNGAVALWRGMRDRGMSDDIVLFGRDGTTEMVLTAPLSQVVENRGASKIAMAGDGTIYALETFDDVVYIFGPDGAYRSSFGESGNEPGQFRAPNDIAVTNRGDILVADIKGIQVFSRNGRYKGLIDVDGPPSGITVDREDVVWIAVRDGVRGVEVRSE